MRKVASTLQIRKLRPRKFASDHPESGGTAIQMQIF